MTSELQKQAAILAEVLTHQKQVDEDGVLCGVSRQAVDETIALLNALASRDAALVVPDAGPWKAGEDDNCAYLQSDDFTHDVRLYINGDFGDRETRMKYAKWLEYKLNAAPQPPATEMVAINMPLLNAVKNVLRHCDTDPKGETAFERDLIALRAAVSATEMQCCGNPAQCWEPCGDLGKSEPHAAVATEVPEDFDPLASKCHDTARTALEEDVVIEEMAKAMFHRDGNRYGGTWDELHEAIKNTWYRPQARAAYAVAAKHLKGGK